MIPAWIAFFDGFLAVALIVAGAVAANRGLTAPFMGFQLFALGMLISVLGLVLGAIGFWSTRGGGDLAPAHSRAIIGTIVCGAVTVLFVTLLVRGRHYPPINDITTDTENPPEFVHAAELPPNQGRDLKYNKAKYADRQRQGYGEIAP